MGDYLDDYLYQQELPVESQFIGNFEDDQWGDINDCFEYNEELPSYSTHINPILDQVSDPQPSSLVSKYFKVRTKQEKKQPKVVQKPKVDQFQELIEQKLEKLNDLVQVYKQELERKKIAQFHYQESKKQYQKERDDIDIVITKAREDCEKAVEQENQKIRQEQRIQQRNQKMIANMPNRKEREEIDGLKQNLNDIFEDVKKKQTRYKLNKERLEKQLADSKNKQRQLIDQLQKLEGVTYKLQESNYSPEIEEESTDIIDVQPKESPRSNVIEDDLYTQDDIEIINEEKLPDNSIVRTYESGHQQIIYPHGARKEVYPNGYSIMYYNNGDIKQVFEDKTVYFYSEASTTHIVYTSGLEVIRFSNGQLEKHYPNGSKKVYYPDSSVKLIQPNGEENTEYPDGSVQKIYANQVREIIHPGGHIDRLHPNGRKERIFFDGKIKTL